MRRKLAHDGVPIENSLPDSLRPGDVVFIDAGSVSHDDFVNVAWTGDPLKDIFTRIAR